MVGRYFGEDVLGNNSPSYGPNWSSYEISSSSFGSSRTYCIVYCSVLYCVSDYFFLYNFVFPSLIKVKNSFDRFKKGILSLILCGLLQFWINFNLEVIGTQFWEILLGWINNIWFPLCYFDPPKLWINYFWCFSQILTVNFPYVVSNLFKLLNDFPIC